MDIRRIIREEVEDFDWIKDVKECDLHHPCVGMLWQARSGDRWMYEIYEIVSMDDKYMYVQWWDRDANRYFEEEHYLMTSYFSAVEDGNARLIEPGTLIGDEY